MALARKHMLSESVIISKLLFQHETQCPCDSILHCCAVAKLLGDSPGVKQILGRAGD